MDAEGKETVIPEKEKDREDEQQEEIEQEVIFEDDLDKEENNKDDVMDANELKNELEKTVAEKQEITERSLRLQAEFENYKRRTEKEKVAERKYKAQDLATELIPVIDNFERALQIEVSNESKSILEGMEMIYEQMQTALKSQGIEVMDVLNEPFDPNLHHAVMQEEDEEKESNIIVEELQKGYMLKDKVIRPAMVKVNK